MKESREREKKTEEIPQKGKENKFYQKKITWIFSIVHFVRVRTDKTQTLFHAASAKYPIEKEEMKKIRNIKRFMVTISDYVRVKLSLFFFFFYAIQHALRFLLRTVLKICISCVLFQYFHWPK